MSILRGSDPALQLLLIAAVGVVVGILYLFFPRFMMRLNQLDPMSRPYSYDKIPSEQQRRLSAIKAFVLAIIFVVLAFVLHYRASGRLF